MEINTLNWLAVIVGTIAAFGLGMIWFSPVMFGKAWARGSHDLKPPSSPPVAAMVVQLAGTFALALVVGMTAVTDALFTAIAAILAAALLIAGMDLFSQKSTPAVLIDAGYIIAAGVLMIIAQGLF